MEIRKVGIVGAGALGVLMGKNLSAALGKENVVFIADPERVRKYEENGLYSNGERCDFTYTSTPVSGPVDLIIFALKIYNLEAALPMVKPFVHEDTILMSVMNGISSEQIIGEALGADRIIYSVALDMDAVKVGNHLSYVRPGLYRIGEADGSFSERLNAVARLFDKAGIKYEIKSNIYYELWSKLMLNTGVNQVLAVLGDGMYRIIHENQFNSRQTMRDAMEEVRILAAKEGVSIADEDIDKWYTIIDGLKSDGMPSMVQDLRAGRETEVELFAGTIKRLGKKHNIPTPVNDWLYEEIMKKS